jgi:hypothetical protein
MKTVWLLLLIVFFAPFAHAQTNSSESLTITTYYPSPMGIYRDLEVKRSMKYAPQADLSTVAVPTQGQLVYVNNTTSGANGFYYYDGSSWQSQASGGGGVCYTNWGGHTCGVGFTAVQTGYVTSYISNFNTLGSGMNVLCSSIAHTSGAQGVTFLGASMSGSGGVQLNNEPCAICCK